MCSCQDSAVVADTSVTGLPTLLTGCTKLVMFRPGRQKCSLAAFRTDFLTMKRRKMMRPLNALTVSMRKTARYSVPPKVPVMESASQGTPVMKNSQITMARLCWGRRCSLNSKITPR